MATEKTSISKQRIATDPRFQRTHDNNAEFAGTDRTSKLLRRARCNLLDNPVALGGVFVLIR